MKVALVHDWLTVIGGSENVFKEIASLFPEADIFTLVTRTETISTMGLDRHQIINSLYTKIAVCQKQNIVGTCLFFHWLIEQFDLSSTTGHLIISSSHAVAKGVLTNSNQIHVCYCHSPIRYAWDLHHQYLKESKLNNSLKGLIVKYLLHRIRQWDIISTNRVDYFIANSAYISKRIKKIRLQPAKVP